ncbi:MULTISPECIES: DUF6461 domain-containing protein [unclassified Streptomyces]|uniref:DUF6461 domain-containing protein n=1 Tax=unclassified Streptomyces TaxID=2593676 RepID=UPI002E813C90|nr:DUF6461 domain-containing protein [Streptomyces sp. NBC_00589]WTI33663.1 DUF6461 domain-containing protein [Streptomyces sp. NBC_00775]WUB32665.1 DUF6461 domain-containing protein [Streptomyces sp. NBC_00589]
MNRRRTENGLRWIADDYNIGFTLTLSEGLSPYELLRSVGAEECHIVPLTRSAAYELLLRDEEDHISDLDFLDWEDDAAVARLTNGGFLPAPPDTIVRAGSVAGWAYALEEFHCHTGTYLAALSQRGRAFCVHRNAKGFSRVDYALHGEPVTSFEPGQPHLTNGAPAEVALGFVHSGNEVGEVAFLRFLEGEFGIYLPWEETEAELPAAAFT